MSSPMPGMERMKVSMSFFMRRTQRLDRLRLRNSDSAPTFLEMDISLSFSTTMSLRSMAPAWFKPSKARPAVMEPSPMTATTSCFSSARSRAMAMPSAAEMDVEECPTPKWS